jgi:hypothetical protein
LNGAGGVDIERDKSSFLTDSWECEKGAHKSISFSLRRQEGPLRIDLKKGLSILGVRK